MKNKFRTIMNFLTVYNLINVAIAFAFELLSPYYSLGGAMVTIANVLFFFISAYSYIAIFGLLASFVGMIYYFIGCLRWQDKSIAYIFLLFSLINIVSIGYFSIMSL